MNLLLAVLLAFQVAIAGPAKIAGPSKLTGTTAPISIDQHGLTSNTATSVTLNFTGVSANTAIWVHLSSTSTSFTISSVADCSGAGPCGSTTDTFTTSNTLTHAGTFANSVADYYTCQSALSGTMSVTVTVNTSSPLILGGATMLNVKTSSCLDQHGVNDASSTNPTVTTVGNISSANEIVLGGVDSATVPMPSGMTSLDLSGGDNTAYKLNPGTGSTTSATWTGSAGNWQASVTTLLHQ